MWVEELQAGNVEVEYEELPLAGHLDTAFGYLITAQQAAASSHQWLKTHLDAED